MWQKFIDAVNESDAGILVFQAIIALQVLAIGYSIVLLIWATVL